MRGLRSSSETYTHSATHAATAAIINSGVWTSVGRISIEAMTPVSVPAVRYSARETTEPEAAPNGWLTRNTVSDAHPGLGRPALKATYRASSAARVQLVA